MNLSFSNRCSSLIWQNKQSSETLRAEETERQSTHNNRLKQHERINVSPHPQHKNFLVHATSQTAEHSQRGINLHEHECPEQMLKLSILRIQIMLFKEGPRYQEDFHRNSKVFTHVMVFTHKGSVLLCVTLPNCSDSNDHIIIGRKSKALLLNSATEPTSHHCGFES